MAPQDKAMALTAHETELLRDLRSRLNRTAAAAPAVAAKSIGPLSKGFFDLCGRTGLEGGEPTATTRAADLAVEADAADSAGLRRVVARLAQARQGDAGAWSQMIKDGVLQAVISRRLALGGREPAKEGVQA